MFNINDRRLIEGERNNLMQVRPLKHSWARDILDQMVRNTWSEKEIDLSEDAKQYATGMLNGGPLIAYKKALAFLSNLDGIQLNNLTTNIGKHITSPEVSMCITRQAWEEAQHVMSYAQMIESIGFDPEEVYWMFERDNILAMKNEFITQSSNIVGKEFTPENFVKAVVGNIVLEGIYFYNGFLTFYAIERSGIMRGSAKMVKLIQKDETAHLHLFMNMWNTLKVERPDLMRDQNLMKECEQIVRDGVEHEITWGKYIISGGVLGLTDKIVESFIQSLANQYWRLMGFDKELYPGVKNLATWFDDASKVNMSNENAFETKVSAYATAALEWD